ncbi:MAG: hypothetical protein A3E88_04390 [Legionellales bacterium RIFCSPHIGHO2_12_FULL_35_11]|nr:MAG: hypothetical protein A3E88_04390 [Legionellales bacterium RIFCSPHIGHO2_12_FULL_35_11]
MISPKLQKQIAEFMIIFGLTTLTVMAMAGYIALILLIIYAGSESKSHSRKSHSHNNCNSCNGFFFMNIYNEPSHRKSNTDILGLVIASALISAIAIVLAVMYGFNIIAITLAAGWGLGVACTLFGSLLYDYADQRRRLEMIHTTVQAVPIVQAM